MDADHFVAGLVARVPEAGPALEEHLRNNDELLLHLFVADLRRMCEDAWSREHTELLGRLLEYLKVGLTTGDERVNNAVAISFVEDSCWYEPAHEDYIASWPEGLRAEVASQRAWWATRGAE